MTNREKIIQWLTICSSGCKENCPYEYSGLVDKNECKTDLMRDALELLKQDTCENCAIAIEDRQMIVQCKNCKWWSNGICINDYISYQIENYSHHSYFYTDSNWFCAYGEGDK